VSESGQNRRLGQMVSVTANLAVLVGLIFVVLELRQNQAALE
jgi:hypothetical protein